MKIALSGERDHIAAEILELRGLGKQVGNRFVFSSENRIEVVVRHDLLSRRPKEVLYRRLATERMNS